MGIHAHPKLTNGKTSMGQIGTRVHSTASAVRFVASSAICIGVSAIRRAHPNSGFRDDGVPFFGREPFHERNVFVEERLADRIALVVMPAAWEGEQFGLKISEPWSALGQQSLPRLELGGGDRHAARFITLGLDCDDP